MAPWQREQVRGWSALKPVSDSVEEEDKFVAHAVGIAAGVEDELSEFAHAMSSSSSSMMGFRGSVPSQSSHSHSHTPAPAGARAALRRGEAHAESSDSGGCRDASSIESDESESISAGPPLSDSSSEDGTGSGGPSSLSLSEPEAIARMLPGEASTLGARSWESVPGLSKSHHTKDQDEGKRLKPSHAAERREHT